MLAMSPDVKNSLPCVKEDETSSQTREKMPVALFAQRCKAPRISDVTAVRPCRRAWRRKAIFVHSDNLPMPVINRVKKYGAVFDWVLLKEDIFAALAFCCFSCCNKEEK